MPELIFQELERLAGSRQGLDRGFAVGNDQRVEQHRWCSLEGDFDVDAAPVRVRDRAEAGAHEARHRALGGQRRMHFHQRGTHDARRHEDRDAPRTHAAIAWPRKE